MNRIRVKVLAVLCMLALLIAGLPYAAVAETAKPQPEYIIPFNDCDTGYGFGNYDYSWSGPDYEVKTDAPASFKAVIDMTKSYGVLANFGTHSPIDATGFDYFEFDLYLEDPAIFQNAADSGIELTSSGTCDVQELCWYPKNMPLVKGWNHLKLPLDEAGYTTSGGKKDFDITHINFFRFFCVGIQGYQGDTYTLRIDDMKLTKDVVNPPVSPDYTAPAQLPEIAPFEFGNLTGEGSSDSLDALVCLRYAVGLDYLDWDQFLRADVEDDGFVDSVDALLYLKKSVGAIKKFPAEEVMDTTRKETVVGVHGNHVVYPIYQNDEPIVAVTDVVAFGAAGDGVTDDTAAFEGALRYARQQGGGVVFVPAGRYVIKHSLTLPNGVVLQGDSPEFSNAAGQLQGTILMAYGGRGKKDGSPFIRTSVGCGLKDVSIWYPEQTQDNIVPYPPTIGQNEQHGFTVENVMLVNSYFGVKMGPQANALQVLRGVYGTPLSVGVFIDQNVDICRMENIGFSPDYWLKSGLEGSTADEEGLKSHLYEKATAFQVQHVDWSYMTDLLVKGYAVGVQTSMPIERPDQVSSPNGQIYNMVLNDCNTGVYLKHVNDIGFLFTKGSITAETPVKCSDGYTTSASFNSFTMTASGRNVVLNEGAGVLSFQDCTLRLTNAGGDSAVSSNGKMTAINSVIDSAAGQVKLGKGAAGSKSINLKNADGSALKVTGTGSLQKVTDPTVKTENLSNYELNYNQRRGKGPLGKGFIDLSAAPYSVIGNETDISSKLQSAIDKLAEEGGGIVYIPFGIYRLEKAITVRRGVEVRGCLPTSHHSRARCTMFYTQFGKNDPLGTALFTLEDQSGISSFTVMYDDQDIPLVTPYSYTVRGGGTNVYIINVDLCNSYQGVDLYSNRCDNHYVEGLTGDALYTAVRVGGGSYGGLIRDLQFNVHYYGDNLYLKSPITGDMITYQTGVTEGIVIGKTVNHICYNNFILGVQSGLVLEDGADATVLAHGTDGGNFSMSVRGKLVKPATLINSQLVAVAGRDMAYINGEEGFDGTVNLIQTNMWGTPGNALILRGGNVNISQGTILRVGTRGLWINQGSASMAGVNLRQSDPFADICTESEAASVRVNGNLYASGMKVVDLGQCVTGHDLDR